MVNVSDIHVLQLDPIMWNLRYKIQVWRTGKTCHQCVYDRVGDAVAYRGQKSPAHCHCYMETIDDIKQLTWNQDKM